MEGHSEMYCYDDTTEQCQHGLLGEGAPPRDATGQGECKTNRGWFIYLV